MDKLTALQVFRRVVELNGFSAAAADLELSNAAVSKNVQQLEAALGVPLITRTTRRLSLTDLGQVYYARIATLLDTLEEADQLVADLGATPRGTLKVNAPMSMGLMSIAPAIQEFLERHPQVSIDLTMSDSFIDLVAGDFDVSIRGTGVLQDSSLISRKIAKFERVACAAPMYLEGHAALREPEDLASHSCLIYTLSSSADDWTFKKDGTLRNVKVSGRFRANSSLALRGAALAGRGIALLPEFMVRADLSTGSLIQVIEGWRAQAQSIYALYPRHRQRSKKLRAFLAFLAERFADGVPI